MHTVLRLDNFRVVIYPNDHRPAHVHVIGQGCEAVFDLHCPDGPSELRDSYDLSLRTVSRIQKALNARMSVLCEARERIHGYA